MINIKVRVASQLLDSFNPLIQLSRLAAGHLAIDVGKYQPQLFLLYFFVGCGAITLNGPIVLYDETGGCLAQL